jgi:tRNA (cytidine/uridine-2'-O-)-methyltransferase
MRLALFEPDIPQNAGALIRLAACMDVGLDIIGPCGFALSDQDVKRVSLDYSEYSVVKEHESWQNFIDIYKDKARIILLTTKSTVNYIKFSFETSDIILVGRESAGVPEYVHKVVKDKVTIPMNNKVRSINVANAASIVLSEAMRQTDLFPKNKI